MKKLICAVLATLLLAASLAACDNIDNKIDSEESSVLQMQEESETLFEESINGTSKEAENPIDDVTSNANNTVMALFEKVFSGEELVWLSDGTSVQLGGCYTYYWYVQQHKNRVAYIDFDGDGIVEALVQSGAYGEHILHYDFDNKKTYATFISPRGGYVYFANGEFCHDYKYDTMRYQIENFDCGNIETVTIDYIDTDPNRMLPTWYDVEIFTQDKG